MNANRIMVALAAMSVAGCASNLGEPGRGWSQNSATPELDPGLELLEGAVEQNRRNRIAIFEGNSLASHVFEYAMNAELRVVGLDSVEYMDTPMTLLEASEADIVIENGEFKVTGTDKSIALPMVALAAYTAHNLPDGMEPGLKEGAFYDPTNFTFPAGAYICEMEVDAGTGKTSFVNFVAADDFGTLINPMIVEGQVHGGLAQGIGQALLEGAVYDSSGQLQTASFMDYTMPRADDLPSFKLSHTTTLCPGNPLGVKGCGEAGAIGASAAVINAITDAIGNNKLEMPASPDRVWHAIHG
jgi:CO/xanthine dehydrogenase Mo-binding subunit